MRGPPRGVESPPREGALHNATTAPDYSERSGARGNAPYSGSASQTLLVDGNISLLRYQLLRLLANNTGTTAVTAGARTSARLDKNLHHKPAARDSGTFRGRSVFTSSGRGGNVPPERQLGREARRPSAILLTQVFKLPHRQDLRNFPKN